MQDIKLTPRHILAFTAFAAVCAAGALYWQHEAKVRAMYEADARRQVELAALEAARAEIPQKQCPVMGSRIYPDVKVEYNGRTVYFCCDSCPDQFLNDPVSYLAKLDTPPESPASLHTQ